jgi:hypothetical protein
MNAAETEKPTAEGTLVRALLSDVYVNYDWNARSRADLERVIPKGGNLAGYNAEVEALGMGQYRGTKNEPGLVESITFQGQLDPCEARPYTKGKQKYELTAGFRRHYAIADIAKSGVKYGDEHPIIADPTWSAKKPTIQLLVKAQTNVQARERNISENTARSGLSTPDLAHAVEDLAHELRLETREEPSNEDLGRRIHRTAGHVRNLRKVMKLPPIVTAHWRTGGEATIAGQRVISLGPISLDAMCGLADLPSGTDYETKYVELVMGLRDQEDGKPKDAAIRRFERALKRASELAELVAFLGHEGIDPAHVRTSEWPKLVELLEFEASAEQLTAIVKRMTDTYDEERAALSSPEDGADDEEEEEATKRRGKRDGGR